jgi:thiamine transporter ThiT
MLFSSRNTEPSVTRLSLIRGFTVGCSALACLGIFDFVTGHAGIGIFLAVVVELLLAILFLAQARREVKFLQAKV